MKKWNGVFIVMDTETGGLPSSLGKEASTEVALCEVAMTIVDSSTLKIVESKSWVIQPYRDDLIYTDESAKITGLNRDKCQKIGKSAEYVADQIKIIAEKYKRGSSLPIVVGQNVDFDIHFIRNFLKMFNKSSGHYDKIFDSEREDTLKWGIYAYPNLNNHKLITIAQECGVELVDSHRAEKDTEATAKVFIEFIRRLRNSYQENNTEKKYTPEKLRYPI